MTKIGLYAGTFDPVHDGHIAFALATLRQCGLDAVVFLPEPKPRGKRGVTDVADRVAMLQALAAVHPQLQVAVLPDEQFTVAHTLPQLQQRFGADLTLLVGSDVARHMPLWDGVGELYKAVHIAVAQRQGDAVVQLPVPVTNIATAHANVTASRIRSGESQNIPPEVRDYIRANGLYSV